MLLFGFFFWNFRTLPVGSKSWVLLQRSTFCFLSAGDSLLRMLPCLGHRKAQKPHCRAPRGCPAPHPALPPRQKFRLKCRHRVGFKKFIPRRNWKGKMISLAISGSGSKVPGTVLETSRIGNSKCILFITRHQLVFYLKSQINLMGKKIPPEIWTLPANFKYLSMAELKI